MPIVRRALVALPALGLALGLAPAATAATGTTGVGLFTAARTALSRVTKFDVNGYIGEGGARMGILVRSTNAGADAEGTMTSTSAAKFGFVGSASFVRVGATFDLKGDARFWKQAAGAAANAKVLSVLVGRWIELPGAEVKSLAGIFGNFSNPKRIVTLFGSPADAARATLGATTVVRGRRVRPIHLGGATLDVVVGTPPLPASLTATDTSSRIALAFSYPAGLTISAPASAVTVTQLEKAISSSSTSTTAPKG